jgi:hypothetical protein
VLLILSKAIPANEIVDRNSRMQLLQWYFSNPR